MELSQKHLGLFTIKTTLVLALWCPSTRSGLTLYGQHGAYAPPTVRIFPGNGKDEINIRENDSIMLSCVATGHPRPQIQWSITGGELERRPLELNSPTLSLSNIKRAEASRVTCRASSGYGSAAVTTTRLNVFYLDNPSMRLYVSKSDPVPNHSIWYENTIVLRCETHSNPAPEVTWYKSGHPIKPTLASAEGYEIRRLSQFSPHTTTYVLKIRNASERNYGNYECRTSLGINGRRFGIPDTKTNFTLSGKIAEPRIELMSPSTVYANPGDAIRLECQVVHGFPEPDIAWIRENDALPMRERFGKKRRTLDLLNVRRGDAGAYFCVAHNRVGNPVKKKVDIVVRYLESMQYWITPDPLRDDRRLAEGTDVKLTCHADAQPTRELRYTWYKRNINKVYIQVNPRNMIPNLHIFNIKEPIVRKFITFPAYSSRLEIRQMTEDDYGAYMCQAELVEAPNGTQVQSVITLTRESAPAQVFPADGEYTVTALEGSRAVLACKTIGRPIPQIMWLRDGNFSVPTDNRKIITTKGGSYIIPNVSRDDADIYSCIPARINGFSKLAKSNYKADITLVVNYPPEVEPKYTVMRKGLGVDVTLTCFVRDAQPPWDLSYKWKKNGHFLAYLSNSENLIFTLVERSDYGIYVCEVENKAGMSRCVINMTGAAYPPEFYYRPEDTMKISSTASSVFPQTGSKLGVFVYLLTWTQKHPKAVDPIREYRIRWRRRGDDLDSDLPTPPPWMADTLKVKGAIGYGETITYELRDLAAGTYEAEVTPVTIFGDGDSSRRIINARKKRGFQSTLQGMPFFCGFDDIDICSFMQESSVRDKVGSNKNSLVQTDEFDWLWNSERNQARRTQDTGPDFDHTRMSKEGGYMFIEASKTRKGDRARLVSPTFRDETSRHQCLKFFYHMKGSHIGILRILLRTEKEKEIWKRSKQQGNDWLSDSITLTSASPYQIIFEAMMTVPNGYQGDIAIDDIVLTNGPCPTPPAVTQGIIAEPVRSSSSGNSARGVPSTFVPLRTQENYLFVKYSESLTSTIHTNSTVYCLAYILRMLEAQCVIFCFHYVVNFILLSSR